MHAHTDLAALAVVEFRHASINGREFQFGLVSRRNRYRAGTRYFSRGIDQGGNVSNFNETEQIVVLTGTGTEADVTFAFVQTRGSVPVYWAEINNLRYKPDLKVLDLATTVRLPTLARSRRAASDCRTLDTTSADAAVTL